MGRNRNRSNSKLFILLLLLVVVGVSVGYAALSKTLKINGTSNIANNANWDIHLANVQVTPGSASPTKAATISGDTVNFAVNLNTPGDFYEFTVDVVNGGTIDAKLSSTPTFPTITAEQQKYITYTIKYDGGVAPAANDTLTHGQTKKIRVRLEFKKDISSLPSSAISLTLNYAMNYVQK